MPRKAMDGLAAAMRKCNSRKRMSSKGSSQKCKSRIQKRKSSGKKRRK